MSSPKEPTLTEAEFQYYWSKFPELDRKCMEIVLELCQESTDEYHQYFTDNNDAS